MATVRFFNDLGAEVLVPVKGDTPDQVRRAVLGLLREYGRMGWRSGDVPRGGFRFPLANEPDFDWRLIGGRRCTVKGDGGDRGGVEEGEGSFSYVTLAVFRGDGRRREEYAVPSAAVNGGAAAGAANR